METQMGPVSPLAVGMRYGLLLAVSTLLVDFLIRVAGFSFLAFGIAVFMGSAVVGAMWVIIAHRAFKRANAGMMNFGQGVIIAVIMLGISGLASGIFNYVYLHYIDLEFVARMKAGLVEFMERNNVPENQIEQSTAKMDAMNMGLGKSLLSGVGNGLTMGVILGLVVSGFTKRNPSEFE